jgi:hypothetical protein
MMAYHCALLPPRLATSAELAGDDLAAAAEAYAAFGLRVFPVHSVDGTGRCSCGKECGRNAGKHPRTPNGLHDATQDLDRVRDWWRRWPEANLAVATGSGSGVWVLDVDPDHGGEASFAALEAAHEELAPTWGVETGGGGVHLWFLHEGPLLRTSAGRLGPGLDVRAEGGYVVVPPSRHRSGSSYRWAEAWHPTLVDLIPAPSWLVALADQSPSPKMIPPGDSLKGKDLGGNHSEALPALIAEGQCNAVLTSLAGVMRRRGCSEAASLATLLIENATRCVPPLIAREIITIARSIGRYAPASDVQPVRPRPRSAGFVEFIGGKAVRR